MKKKVYRHFVDQRSPGFLGFESIDEVGNVEEAFTLPLPRSYSLAHSLPYLILQELERRGERLVGSLPDGFGGSFIITEPIAQEAKPNSDLSPYDLANAPKLTR